MTPAEKIKRIEKALRRAQSTHTWEDVRESIVKGESRIFDNDHGCWITEIRDTPQKRWLNVWIVAGELPHVMGIQEEVERYALTSNCAFLGAVVRPGWKNVYPKYGWKLSGHAIVKEVQP